MWWLALHGLLLAGAMLVGAVWWLRGLCVLAVVAHGILRRPAATPTPILMAEDGSCCVPALGTAWLVPGPRTRLAAYWVQLSLVGGQQTRDILLCVDQLDTACWARLNARLRRRPPGGTSAEARAQRTRQVDLR